MKRRSCSFGWGDGECGGEGEGEAACDDGSDGWTDVERDEMGDGMAVCVLIVDEGGLDRDRDWSENGTADNTVLLRDMLLQ
jgi:hypothetical protein